MYASFFPGEHLKNLVLLAAPVDFAPAGPLTPWTREGLVDPHAVVEALGNVPAWRVGDLQQGAGELELRGRRVDLSNVECPILNIAGSKDRICPLPQAEATMELVSSPDKRFLALDAGHVGLIVGPAAREEMWLCTGGWLELRSGARSGG